MSIAALLPPKHGRYGRYKVCTNDLVIKMFVFSRVVSFIVIYFNGHNRVPKTKHFLTVTYEIFCHFTVCILNPNP